jgi:threonine synthase
LVSRNVLAKSQVPRLLACEAADRGKTFASAIRIERAVNEPKAARALEWTGGHRVAVTDDEIREAQKFLAQREGVLVEPASAASLAGLRRAVRGGSIASSADAVLVLTGSGLKDPDSATELGSSPQVVEASRDALSHALARPLGIFTPAGPAEARAGAIG